MNILISAIISILISLLVFIVLLLVWPKKGKMGINLSKTKCSKCDTVLPLIRRPKNLNQIIWGGCTCPNCGSELDNYGNEKNT